MIPEDWEIINFGDLVNYTKGYAFKSSEYVDDGVRVIRVSDTTYDSIEDDGAVFVSERSANSYKKWCLRENDLIFSTVGSKPPMYDSLVGKVILLPREYSGSLLNQNAVVIRTKKYSESFQKLLLNHFRTDRYIQYIEIIFRGNANQASITLVDLFKYKIPLPPTKTEQTAIANALSDIDALIQSLSRLIAKKRQIKQGAMQTLLNPYENSRLKEGWVVKKLGDECELITKGTTPTSIGKDFHNSGINFIKIETVGNSGEILKEKLAYIDVETHAILKRSQLKEDDLLVSIAGALGRTCIVKKEFLPANTNQALAIARLKQESMLVLKFVYFTLKTERIKKHIEGISVQGAQANLSLQNIYDLPVEHPLIEEQSRIATILSDMDADIAALETKLAKIQQIKQGMMQNLLTGTIRLI